MTDTTQFLLWFLGIPAAMGVIALIAFGVEWSVSHAEHAAARVHHRFSHWREAADASSMRRDDARAFYEWLSMKAGADMNGAVDERLVEAQKQAELIRILIEEEVPNAVLRCVETHRLTARVTGACHFLEVAYEPECYQLRAKVAWLLSHTVRFLESYPLRLDDARLLHNSIVLRKRALPTCRRCPYIQMAELIQIRETDDAAKQ
jgi:hypothetical protein